MLDLPPGHRGYGDDARIPMRQTVDEYNDTVDALQIAAGRLDESDFNRNVPGSAT